MYWVINYPHVRISGDYFFVSPKLLIDNVVLCRPSPGVFMMEQHCSVRELNCIMLVRLTGAMDARTVTFRGHAM